MITNIPFGEKHSRLSIFEPNEGTLVVIPSLSLPQDELRRITGALCYEERLLFLLLTLRQPDVEVVYLSSAPVDTAIVDYYLGFLDDPDEARTRLQMISLDDPHTGPLTVSLLRRPDVVARIRAALGRTAGAWMVPFVVSEAEERLAEILGLPIYGPATSLAHLGSKSGGRMIAEEAGVPMARGFADLRSLTEVEHAARALSPSAKLMVKLNNSYSGLGNAVVIKDERPLTACHTSFSAADENWTTFAEKIAERGAVIEEFIEDRPLYSPSALARITPGGAYDVVATHEQLLGGPNGDLYQGCAFPARPEYRAQVGECAERIARVLAGRGVVGLFGMDFFAVKTDAGYRALLCEINLRIGGTTHPFGAALLTTGASYDPGTGTLVHGGRSKYYVATDNCTATCLRGRTPAEVVELIDDRGLGFDREARTGNVLHLLGAVPEYGKLGFTSIGDSAEEAAELHQRTLRALNQSA
ncbi:D-alanine-D-alanine ligase [Streptosporangium canum]|uniref:D-alanine-D-alanine ligase n=1 Tax=Streptosporangium canum TaxID=324952 RepID=A0A1I3FLI5_9ACTN|nr:peptide ligase PGM1-related protein [Streptosporangium canum]SFI11781.1 D-alanine-D-alanine ligase [Streptosporangium canum]